jgi:hypothetical protein
MSGGALGSLCMIRTEFGPALRHAELVPHNQKVRPVFRSERVLHSHCTTNGFAFRARGLGGFRHLISPTGLAFEECEELLNIIKNTV